MAAARRRRGALQAVNETVKRFHLESSWVPEKTFAGRRTP